VTNVRFIRQFQQDYHAGVHHLVENYRSTANIIAASNQLIAGNQDRMKTEHPICIDHRRGLNPAGGILDDVMVLSEAGCSVFRSILRAPWPRR